MKIPVTLPFLLRISLQNDSVITGREISMKTSDERSAFRQEAEALNKEYRELTGEELSQVAGGTQEAYHEAEGKIYNVFYDYKLNGYSKFGFTREPLRMQLQQLQIWTMTTG